MNYLLQNISPPAILAVVGIVLCMMGCSRHDKVRTRMTYLRTYLGMALLIGAIIALTIHG